MEWYAEFQRESISRLEVGCLFSGDEKRANGGFGSIGLDCYWVTDL